MQIMKKSLLLVVACLALPLATFAADTKPARAPAASAVNSREAVQASKQRGSAMGACQQKATDQKLVGEERKTFLVTCMKG
jgi:Skp family chaperone for outer membrane proteins